MDKKAVLILSLAINFAIIILDGYAISQSFFQWKANEVDKLIWYQAFTYYTEDSNISLFIGAIASFIGSILILNGKKNKSYLRLLKYLGVVTTMVTFFTVYVFIIITKDIRLGFSTTGNLWLIVHTICPLLGIISFIFFDEKEDVPFKYIFIPIIFTICYTIMILIVNLCGGRIPYISDFNKEYSVNGWKIMLLGVIEVVITSILALSIRHFKNVCNRR